jgi:hypothetical protein
MANFYNSPNMNLVIPVPTLAPGPAWAQGINASLITLDAHNHSAGNGVLINPTGLNINEDLSFLTNNATAVRSVRFNPNASPITASSPDLGALYEAGVDLYYNDGNGNQIRITQSGAVAGATGTITGLPAGTASAAYTSAQGTFVFQQATSIAANLDVATVIVRYPGSYPTPSGNYIALEAPSSLASGYALTLPALPAQTNVMTLGTTGIISSTTWDQVGVNMTSTGANAVANTRTRATGTTVAAGGVAVSASGGLVTTSSTYVDVTNLAVTLTTTGRPVYICVINDGSGTPSSFYASSTGVICLGYAAIVRDSTIISEQSVGIQVAGTATAPTSNVPSSTLQTLDVIGAGTYTYKVQLKRAFASETGISGSKLVAYEL